MKKQTLNALYGEAAKASGITTEKFAHKVRGLLNHSRCRDTDARPVFNASVVSAISNAVKVSRH